MNARTLRSAMSSRRVSHWVALATLLCSNVAHAQGDAAAAETAAARSLAVEGVKLALAHRCDDALDKLDRAQKLKPSPVVLRHLGECQIELGRWVEGSESLRKLLREPVPEDASPAVEQAHESAAATLRELKPRIPSMKILVNGPRDVDIVVKLDGKEIANSVVGVPLPADPGDHVVEVSAPGFLHATSSVKLAPGSAQTVTIALKRDPSWLRQPESATVKQSTAARAPEPATKPRSDAPSTPATSSSTEKTLGYLSYGVAAAGLGVGIAFGQSAMKDERELRESCPNQVCSEEDRDSLEFAKTKGTISTIGFATAGAGIALGTVLVLTAPSAPSSNSAGSTQRPRTASPAFRPRAKIGLGRVTLATDF